MSMETILTRTARPLSKLRHGRLRRGLPLSWAKSVGGLRRSRLRGIEKTQVLAHIVGAAYNLLRIARLLQ